MNLQSDFRHQETQVLEAIVLVTFSFCDKHQDQGNLKKKTFNMGTHDSRGLEAMTNMMGSVAAGKQAWR